MLIAAEMLRTASKTMEVRKGQEETEVGWENATQ